MPRAPWFAANCRPGRPACHAPDRVREPEPAPRPGPAGRVLLPAAEEARRQALVAAQDRAEARAPAHAQIAARATRRLDVERLAGPEAVRVRAPGPFTAETRSRHVYVRPKPLGGGQPVILVPRGCGPGRG